MFINIVSSSYISFLQYSILYLLGEICRQFFCNMYFQQCQRPGCLGCLNRLRGNDPLFLYLF
jgi:hypothetical protein